jgi:hypothetical protein
MGVASPPPSLISRATVVMVEAEEFGSGGKGVLGSGEEVLFAATTTGYSVSFVRNWEGVGIECGGMVWRSTCVSGFS